ncbi:hypothetical protein Sjap_001286 [Stephania japonica]|uniref:Phospholipid:diacylglycerol acyltransferase 2 n=1 Tax=Stephania japonica TaxID=461633 RepID=A0AAP0PUW4_9MAGN
MASSILRFRKLCYVEPVNCFSDPKIKDPIGPSEALPKQRKQRKQGREWRCWDMCLPESPGLKLKDRGLSALHPVVLVPGIVTGGLELWEGRPCAEGLFRKRLWGGSFTEIFKRPLCWLEHLSLDNETGLDPPGIRVRAVPGLVAADYFSPGYFVWAVLIENLAKIGYEGKNLYMTAYDWRISFQNTEAHSLKFDSCCVKIDWASGVRDQALSRLKSKIELMFVTNGYKKVVVVPHSMGSLYFLHFLKWVEAPPPMGGGGGPGWCAKHIKTIMNIGPAFLGVPRAVSNIFSAEAKDIAFARSMAPGFLNSDMFGLQTLERVLRVSRTWDSVISLLPKGGETASSQANHSHPITNSSNGKLCFGVEDPIQFGRIISFGKDSSQLPSSQLKLNDVKELLQNRANQKESSCSGEVWTEYEDMSKESIQAIAENKAYTVKSYLDLLRFAAPGMMKRAEAHFSHGIAENLDDPKYSHYKYWSNPLETKLPDAPDMEIHCLYGVGIPTERSYVYKLSTSNKCKRIPFRIDDSANGNDGECLKSGVYFVDGDESVPVISTGYMCARGWRGKTRFNPSGSPTRIREYRHKAPANLFEGRGFESGAHVDILGNVAMIEDIMRVAAGEELGGDRIYSIF